MLSSPAYEGFHHLMLRGGHSGNEGEETAAALHCLKVECESGLGS